MKKILFLVLVVFLISLVSAGEYIEPLDLKTLLVNFFLGSMELFIFGFVIIFSYACARMGIPDKIYLVLLAVSLLLVSLVAQINGIYVLVVCLIGFVSFKAITKLVT